MDVLKTIDLGFSYEKGNQVLKDINMEIAQGSFTAILGANGCGKTTLIQMLSGILKPSSGQVLLKGMGMRKLKEREIFSTVGLVFQNPDDQLFSYTVREDVAYGPSNLGIRGDELDRRVEDALKVMGIYDLKEREVHKLSYGQKKRAAIAGILAMKPQVLILDEPTAALDPLTASSLVKVLKAVQEEGVTVVITTHEVDIVPVCCDYTYVMKNGGIEMKGTPEEVFGFKEKLRECGLRLPRIGHLMEILNDRDKIDIDSSAMTISAARIAVRRLLGREGGN